MTLTRNYTPDEGVKLLVPVETIFTYATCSDKVLTQCKHRQQIPKSATKIGAWKRLKRFGNLRQREIKERNNAFKYFTIPFAPVIKILILVHGHAILERFCILRR